MKRLRGALFGLGRMGAHHARRLSERGDVDLVVVDPARGYAEPAGLAQGLDFAVVATPAATHAAVAGPLLAAGVPCLVEKPLASNLEAACSLSVFENMTVGHIERFNPALDPLAGVRPRFVQSERLAPPQGRGSDVDVVTDLMVHDLDLAMRWLGPVASDVRAVGVGVLGGEADIVHARLELGGGVAVLAASRVSHAPSRRLRVVEEGVYWSVDLAARTVARVRWGEGRLDPEPVAVPEGDALVREHAAFLAAVRGEATFPVPGSEALAVMALAEVVRGRARAFQAAD